MGGTEKGLASRIAALRKDLSNTELDILCELGERPCSDRYDLALAVNERVEPVNYALDNLVHHGLIAAINASEKVWTAYVLNQRDFGGIQPRWDPPRRQPHPTDRTPKSGEGHRHVTGRVRV
jgi:hypothetical protein